MSQSVSPSETPEMLDVAGLDLLFRAARTHTAWLPKPVTEEQLHAIYELCKWGPTSANACPVRILFLQSEEAKARVLPVLAPNNVEKSRTAPVVAVIAYDREFYEKLPELYPAVDARAWFVGKPDAIEATAFRNSSLQGAYFMLAARALGLDCGPMSGFDADKLNAEFFSDGNWIVNFVCNLGYGDPDKLHPRNPRLDFDDACKIL
jgi:3-hydroxypropanoate dehydrogenase